jgi:hypothetical protein
MLRSYCLKLVVLALALLSGVLGRQDGMVCFKDNGRIEVCAADFPCCDEDSPALSGQKTADSDHWQPVANCTPFSECSSCFAIPDKVVSSRWATNTDENQSPLATTPLLPYQYSFIACADYRRAVSSPPASAFPQSLSSIVLRC